VRNSEIFGLVFFFSSEFTCAVANTFYDPSRNQTFYSSVPACNLDGTWWNGGEPLWVTAVKQDVKSAAVFWPGSEAEIRGHRPTFYLKFNQAMPYVDRVAQAMTWLKLPRGKRPRFVTMYFDRVDSVRLARASSAHVLWHRWVTSMAPIQLKSTKQSLKLTARSVHFF
jgi:predicted AlkP superfamily pyrophosphatase or phosphodiesterase